MTDEVNYEALGFRLTAHDVAEVLEVESAAVLDYVRAGELAFLSLPKRGGLARLGMRFHPEEIRLLQHRIRQGALSADTRTRMRVQALLRRYLQEVPATGDYDLAITRGLPLLAGTKAKREAVHVRPEALTQFQARTEAPAAPILPDSLCRALEAIGALRVRGVIPSNDRGGKQRWATWWRIPESVAGEDESATIADVVSGVLHGDSVTRKGSGDWYVNRTLGAD